MNQRITGVDFSGDSRFMLVSTQTEIAQVWDIDSSTSTTICENRQTHIDGAALSPDGKLVAIRSRSYVEVWPVGISTEPWAVLPKNSTPLPKTQGTPSFEWSPAISTDGEVIACKQFNAIKVLQTKTASLLQSFECPGQIDAYELCADGSRLAFRDQRNVQVWNTHTGALLLEKQLYQLVGPISFSPNGERLVLATAGTFAHRYGAFGRGCVCDLITKKMEQSWWHPGSG